MSQISLLNDITCGASLSSCRTYRYSLWREWDKNKGVCVFIGLNPSTADESIDDPTIRRCIGFAKAWGYGRLVMVNLFAIRATDPNDMKTSSDPIGCENNAFLLKECESANLIVAAWGNHGTHMNRYKDVSHLLSHLSMKCFKITKSHQPAHPLYQPGSAALVDYRL